MIDPSVLDIDQAPVTVAGIVLGWFCACPCLADDVARLTIEALIWGLRREREKRLFSDSR